jgi:hypothetical protein
MRTDIFLIGMILVILGPIVTVLGFTSCLGTILSGHLLACVTDLAYVIIGGSFFVVGIIMGLVGVFSPDPVPTPSTYSATPPIAPETPVKCKKCGRVYDSSLFFCPSCGQRPS